MGMSEAEKSALNLLPQKPRKGDLRKIDIIKAMINCIAIDGYEQTTYEINLGNSNN